MDLMAVFLTFALCFYPTRCQFDTGMTGDRRVIVHLFEWPFDDIKHECKAVLGPQKFGGVLVQPITEHLLIKTRENVKRPWYERYQPLSWNIRSRLGTEQQFKQMVEECNKNDVRVYVDTVFNHAVGHSYGQENGDVEGVGGSHANVRTKSYPGLGYSEANFHKSCEMDWKNKTSVRICELADLQDVDQSQDYVQKQIVTFLNKLIDFGVAGFRIDAAKHMWPEDLRKIYSMLRDVSLGEGKQRMRPIWFLEVYDHSGSYQEDYKDMGPEYEFEFLFRVTKTIQKGESSLANIYEYAKNPYYVSKKRVALTSNQNIQRNTWPTGFPDTSYCAGIQRVVDALILTFTGDIPNIFSGYSYMSKAAGPPMDGTENIISARNCTDGWMCEHRFPPHQWIIKYFTNFVQDAPIETWYSDWDGGTPLQAAFTRGQSGFAVFNAAEKPLKQAFKVSLPPGMYCDLATGYYCPHHRMCMGKNSMKRKVEVREDGTVEVSLPAMMRPPQSAASKNSVTVPAEPPYLVISLQSMFPPKEVPNKLVEIAGWIVLGIAVVVAIVVVTLFLRRQSRSKSKDFS